MSEQELRAKLEKIDGARARAALLDRMARWPMFSPSHVRADKRTGILRWFGFEGYAGGPVTEVALTREERSELREWLTEKAARLRSDADALSGSLDQQPGDPQPIVFDPPLTEAESDAYWDAIKPDEREA